MNVAATVYRGDLVENTHAAHVAVVDAEGLLIYAFGDPSRMTLARSAAKPAQALAVLETGALDRFGFDDADRAHARDACEGARHRSRSSMRRPRAFVGRGLERVDQA
jgi:L-asparaginase II